MHRERFTVKVLGTAVVILLMFPFALSAIELEWGMTQTEVIERNGEGPQTSRRAGTFYRITVFGKRGNAELDYSDDKLTSVTAYIHEDAFLEIFDRLVAEFDEPSERSSTAAHWSEPDLEVSLVLELRSPSRTVLRYEQPSPLIGIGDAPPPLVNCSSHIDEFTDTEWVQIELQRDGQLNYLGFRRFPDSSNVVMALRYYGGGWRFIDSIYFLVDGDRHRFTSGNTDRDTRRGGYVREWVTWFLPIEELAFLYESDPSEIRYSARGNRGQIDGDLTDDQIQALTSFLSDPYSNLPAIE